MPSDSDTRAAFLRAAAADPADDLVRLAFADWLDERGDPQGEFVRLDLELAGLADDDPRHPTLAARRDELLDLHHAEWLAAPPAFRGVQYTSERHPRGRFVRGLPAFADITWKSALDHGAAVFAAAPVSHLGFERPGEGRREDRLDRVAAACEQPWWSRATHVEFGANGGFDNAAAATFARCPSLTNCVSLQVRVWTGLDHTRGIPALVESESLANLEELQLSGHDIGREETEQVAASRRWTRLKSYTSCGVQMSAASVMGNAGIEALAAAPVVRLRALRVPAHSIDHAGADVLARSPAFAGLESLDLSGNHIGDAGARSLAGSPVLTRLRRLVLRQAGVGPRGAEALAGSAAVGNLRELDLAFNPLTDDAALALAASPHLPSACRVRVGFRDWGPRMSADGFALLRERFPQLVVVAPGSETTG